ncbi:MAG: Mor transcription activator family protein [Desulfarculaceae bacterium]
MESFSLRDEKCIPSSRPELKFLPEWIKQVTPQDLPEVYQEMAEVIGVEATVYLARIFAGTSVYFPKLERALLSQRNRVIRREFDGANIKMLARRWGLSARHVRHIVNPHPSR